jgi:transcriptional regulator with XRE-family HTH domain
MAVAMKNGRAMARPPVEPDESEYLGRVAKRLKGFRERAGLDADQAALAITRYGYEVTPGTVYRWERGDTQPHLEAFPAITKAYRLSSIRLILPNE